MEIYECIEIDEYVLKLQKCGLRFQLVKLAGHLSLTSHTHNSMYKIEMFKLSNKLVVLLLQLNLLSQNHKNGR